MSNNIKKELDNNVEFKTKLERLANQIYNIITEKEVKSNKWISILAYYFTIGGVFQIFIGILESDLQVFLLFGVVSLVFGIAVFVFRNFVLKASRVRSTEIQSEKEYVLDSIRSSTIIDASKTYRLMLFTAERNFVKYNIIKEFYIELISNRKLENTLDFTQLLENTCNSEKTNAMFAKMGTSVNVVIKLEWNDFAKEISHASLSALNEYLQEIQFNQYNFVEIKRSTKKDVDTGTSIYMFSDASISLSKLPGHFASEYIDDDLVNNFFVYDVKLESSKININANDIFDIKYQGTQLMESSVQSSGIDTPGLFKTGLSEFFFGSSYTMLKGISNFSINTSHSINDTRTISVYFNDKTDIEFIGYNIYHEFYRRFGDKKNKERHNELVKAVKNKNKKEEAHDDNKLSVISKLKELNDLLKEGVISKEEFEKIKSDLLK